MPRNCLCAYPRSSHTWETPQSRSRQYAAVAESPFAAVRGPCGFRITGEQRIEKKPVANAHSESSLCHDCTQLNYRAIRLRGGRRNRPRFDLAQNLAQHRCQFFAAHLALAELHAHVEGIVLGAVVEQERLRTRRRLGLFLPRATRFIARQSSLRDALPSPSSSFQSA